MTWIDEITKGNFDRSFNIQNVLKDSVFYPASGTDIGSESIATFDALYVNNGINPLAVTIINPSESEGYGDNWTRFTDPNYRFYQLIQLNIEKHDQKMPRYVYTDYARENRCLWPDYKRINLKYRVEGLVFEYKTFN